jgi:hypothetical protein
MHEDVNVREPVVAWRKWEVSIDDGLLLSLFKDAVWIPGERLEAKCLNSGGQIMSARRTCTRAPSRNCACGIYGVFHKEDTHKFGATKAFPTITCTLSKLTVIGQVSLWGRIHEHERGLKAEFAYPYELLVQRPPVLDIAEGTRIAKDVARRLASNYLVDASWV